MGFQPEILLEKISKYARHPFLFLKVLKNYLIRWMPSPLKQLLRPIYRAYWNLQHRKVLEMDRASLRDALERYQNKPLIIFAPSLDWNVQLFQRPQQLAVALAGQGATVFYIQPNPDRNQSPIREISPGLLLCNIFCESFDIVTDPIVYFLTWNYGYRNIFKNPTVLYDYVDDIQVFYADQDLITRYHKEMIENAALVMVTAQKLYQEIIQCRQDAVYCPNGVDYAHFNPTTQENNTIPEDIAELVNTGKPIVGYYGALARWFDYELLKKLSTERPDTSIVLIGPDYDGTFEPSGIKEYKNIHWLGVKSYADLPDYLEHFDVAVIPFLLNDITHATSPLKLFEYMAARKPTVVTAMQESMRYDGVLVATNPSEFVERVDQALTLKHDPAYLALIDRVARENTWSARARQIIDSINKLPSKLA